MRCPTLKELPQPPQGKIGWPWTEESSQLPDKMPDGSSWPKISIVTPSLNQGQFIEETIRSVLLQGYPDLEYIIIDGGSTDNSIDILKEYEKWLTYWVSEPDLGQAHAINKGFKIATGAIVAWLNSDDNYCMHAFQSVADHLTNDQYIFLYGNIHLIDENSIVIDTINLTDSFDLKNCFGRNLLCQPACFWNISIFNDIGYLNENMHFVFDAEFWIRINLKKKFSHIPTILANFRVHKDSKSVMCSPSFAIESFQMYSTFFSCPDLPKELKKRKKETLRYWNEVIARNYLESKLLHESRRYFMRAIFSDLFRKQNLTLITDILDTFCEFNLKSKLQHLNKYFTNRTS